MSDFTDGITSSGMMNYAQAMGPVACAILGEPTQCHIAKGELRWGTNGSLAVDTRKGRWFDHEANEGGGVLDFVQLHRKTDKAGAFEWLQDCGYIEKPTAKQKSKLGKEIASYDYTDAQGATLFQVVHFDRKTFRQRHINGDGGWKWGLGDTKRVLYHLPAIAALKPGSRVYIVEGEKSADALAAIGLTATCSPMGANKWRNEYSAYLRDLDVVILPDNDEPGSLHAAMVAKSLNGIAKRARALTLPDLPDKGDVADWLAKGGTAEQLEQLAEDIPQDEPPPPPQEDDVDATVARLAALSLARYEQARQAEAKRLNLRASILDKLVAQARPANTQENQQGRALSLPVPEPWPEPVDGEQILTDLTKFFANHAFLQKGAPYALTLWTVHTYAFEVFTHSPRLHVRGIVKNSGKTTVLELIEMVCCRPLPAANVTSAAMFRTIEMAKPTLLLDEADTFLNEAEELRGIVNAGHKRGGQVLRTVGEAHEPRLFAVFAPVAIAGIGDLPGTIADRSITIPMKRALKAELPSPITKHTNAMAAELTRKIARWAIDSRNQLVTPIRIWASYSTGRRTTGDRCSPSPTSPAASGPNSSARQPARCIITDDGTETLDIELLADIRTVVHRRQLQGCGGHRCRRRRHNHVGRPRKQPDQARRTPVG